MAELTGKRVETFSLEATLIGDNDFFGVAQDVGAGSYQTKKFKGAVFGKRGNLLYVDKVFGSDTLGTRGRADRPFLTLNAAKTAAQVGDTIVVRPGTYAEGTINKNGVNWHFMNGAVVDCSALAVWVMNDSNSDGGTNAAFTSRVTGLGTFIGGFWVSQGASDLYVEALTIQNGTRNACVLTDNGILRVKAVSIALLGVGAAVNANGGTLIVEADTMTSNSAALAVVWLKNTAFVRARTIAHGNGFHAVENVAAAGGTFVSADAIIGGASISAVLFSGTGGTHQIVDSKIFCGGGNGSAIEVTQNGLAIRNCTLVGAGTGFSIEAPAARTVQAWSYILGNKALSNVTITDDSAPSRFVQSAAVA